MTVTVRPPLISVPNPRPKWWGTNPDAYEVMAYQPTLTALAPNLYDGGIPQKKLPPHIPVRQLTQQVLFSGHLFDQPIIKRWPEPVDAPITHLLPTATPQPLNTYDGGVPVKKLPPHMVVGRQGLSLTAAAAPYNLIDGPPPPKKYPPPYPVRVQSPSAPSLPQTVLAQLQSEFDAWGMPKKQWPGDNYFPNVAIQPIPAVTPPTITYDYPSRLTVRWVEDAAFPNVAAQPPLVALAQQITDYEPQGRVPTKWAQDAPYPNIAIQPLSTIPPVINYDYLGKVTIRWPEDAAPTNVASLPTAAPITPYEYVSESKPLNRWPEDAAPANIWVLPLATAPVINYDYPVPIRRTYDNWMPPNIVLTVAPPPPLSAPPLVFEWPKHLTLTWDDFGSPYPLTVPPVPIYIPVLGYEIYIPPRRFTVATPVRSFALIIASRTFTIQGTSGVQTFDVKDPLESWPLTFNMAPDLFNGETLTGAPTVSVTLIQGADPNPSGILNGLPGFDQTATQVIQPVTGGIAGCTYEITVSCSTSNVSKSLTLRGALPVQV